MYTNHTGKIPMLVEFSKDIFCKCYIRNVHVLVRTLDYCITVVVTDYRPTCRCNIPENQLVCYSDDKKVLP